MMTNPSEAKRRSAAAERFVHFAYISYAPQDARWARRIRRQLNGYRLSAKTHRRYIDLPRRCRPIVMRRNVGAIGLDPLRVREIQSSKFFIVICSRHARQNAPYMDAELQCFLEGGGAPFRVLPLLIEKSDRVKQTCFPRRLEELCAETNIVGANIRDDGPRTAVLKLIASMLGIRREELESDDTRRRRLSIRIATVLCALLVCACVACWLYFTPRTAYYLDYTEVFGRPTGIGRLWGQALKTAPQHYAIVSARGLPRELRYENAGGALQSHGSRLNRDRPSKITYEYRQDGMLNLVRYFNSADREIFDLYYSDINQTQAVIDLISGTDEDSLGTTVALSLTPLNGDNAYEQFANRTFSSGISRYWLFFDGNGHTQYRFYISDPKTSAVAADSDGANGVCYTRDALGRVKMEEYLKHYGSGSFDVASWEYDYIFSASGKTSDDIKYTTFDYDEAYNCISMRFLDAGMTPVRGKDGYAGVCSAYDSNHGSIEDRFLDEHGNLTANADGYAIIRCEYDAKGNAVRQAYFDNNDAPTAIPNGASSCVMGYDDQDNMTSISLFDTQGNPFLSPQLGWASIERSFDARRNPVETRFFDAQGAAYVNPFVGCAAWRQEFDERGNVVSVWYYDADGAPYINPLEGFASITQEFDAQGNVTCTRYFDAKGQPYVNPLTGCASIASVFNEYGQAVNDRYFDAENRPCVSTVYGASEIAYEYDDWGYFLGESYFDESGAPMRHEGKGCAGFRQYYDDRMRISMVVCLDTDGNPCRTTGGYAVRQYDYDADGQMTLCACLDENFNITRTEYGYSGIRTYPDDSGIYRHEFLDVEGTPVDAKGAAGYEVVLDSCDRPVRWTWLDEHGDPVAVDGAAGYVVDYYMDSEMPTEFSSFGQDAVPPIAAAHRRMTFDAHGRMTGKWQYDDSGALIPLPDLSGSCCGITFAYDSSGRIASAAFFGPDGRLTVSDEGYACREADYDDRGRLSSERYWGADGKPMLYNGDYASVTYTYDDMNRCTAQHYCGVNDAPVLAPSVGSCAVTSEYDARGNMIMKRHLDSEDRLMLTAEGYAIEQTEYDEWDNPIAKHWLGLDGEPIITTSGVAGLLMEYDSRGNLNSIVYIDVYGNPVAFNGTSSSGLRYTYDGRGRRLSVDPIPVP